MLWVNRLKKSKVMISIPKENPQRTNSSLNLYNDISSFVDKFGNLKNKRILEELLEIDGMSGTEFEKYCINLLDLSGLLPYALYATTKTSGDYGADVIITTAYGLRISVQCKRLKSSPVRVDAIQEVVASKKYYKTKESMIITNSKLTPNAMELAETNGVFVIDRDKLEKLIRIKNTNLKPILQKTQWKNFIQQMES